MVRSPVALSDGLKHIHAREERRGSGFVFSSVSVEDAGRGRITECRIYF